MLHVLRQVALQYFLYSKRFWNVLVAETEGCGNFKSDINKRLDVFLY